MFIIITWGESNRQALLTALFVFGILSHAQFREELGVELGSGLAGRVACLGRLDDRLVRTRTPFAVATFVFLQLDLAPTEFRVRLFANEARNKTNACQRIDANL